MKLKNEDDLDNFIICHNCYTLHEEIAICDGSKACCSECSTVLYRYDSKLIEHGLALSITGLIFFVLANFFPVVKIEILGHEQYITISKTFIELFDNGFYVVGLLCAFVIFIFPLMIFMINIMIFMLLKFQKREALLKELLILLANIKPWSMLDIFLISILVALVKLIGYAQIDMGISFWALFLFVLVDLYITKMIHISEIWMLRNRLYKGNV